MKEINPDTVLANSINAKLKFYKAKGNFEASIAEYNDVVGDLLELVNGMKARIIELEKPSEEGSQT